MVAQQSFTEPRTLGEWTYKLVQEFVPQRALRVSITRAVALQAALDSGVVGVKGWAAPAAPVTVVPLVGWWDRLLKKAAGRG